MQLAGPPGLPPSVQWPRLRLAAPGGSSVRVEPRQSCVRAGALGRAFIWAALGPFLDFRGCSKGCWDSMALSPKLVDGERFRGLSLARGAPHTGRPGPWAPPFSHCSRLLCQLPGPPLLYSCLAPSAALWGSARPAASAESSGTEGSSLRGEEGGLTVPRAGQQLGGEAGLARPGWGRGAAGDALDPHPCRHHCPGQDPGVVREGPVWAMMD